MPKTSVQLREERAELVKKARSVIDKPAAEDRELTPEETTEYENIMKAVDAIKASVDRLEALENAEAEADVPAERSGRPVDVQARERERADPNAGKNAERTAYRQWLKSGEVRQELRGSQSRMSEYRDTVISTDAKGGYLIAPTQVSDDVVQIITDMVFMRQLANVVTVTEAKKLGIRKLTTHMADADWTTEVQAVTEDTTLAFNRRDLEPYLLTKLSRVSMRTLMLAKDSEKIINDELAYKFGVTEEKGFLTGDGSSKPLGVFVASSSGISTGRDVASTNTATAFTADGLIDAKYSLKSGYQNDPSTAWIFHRDAIKMARKLKDSTNQYIWAPGLSAGEPDRILDTPFYTSEYAPNTFTTGLYVGIIGAFRFYTIAQVGDLIIQRVNELYAGTNEVGFIGRRWVDGAPILEEAFARVKLG